MRNTLVGPAGSAGLPGNNGLAPLRSEDAGLLDDKANSVRTNPNPSGEPPPRAFSDALQNALGKLAPTKAESLDVAQKKQPTQTTREKNPEKIAQSKFKDIENGAENAGSAVRQKDSRAESKAERNGSPERKELKGRTETASRTARSTLHKSETRDTEKDLDKDLEKEAEKKLAPAQNSFLSELMSPAGLGNTNNAFGHGMQDGLENLGSGLHFADQNSKATASSPLSSDFLGRSGLSWNEPLLRQANSANLSDRTLNASTTMPLGNGNLHTAAPEVVAQNVEALFNNASTPENLNALLDTLDAKLAQLENQSQTTARSFAPTNGMSPDGLRILQEQQQNLDLQAAGSQAQSQAIMAALLASQAAQNEAGLGRNSTTQVPNSQISQLNSLQNKGSAQQSSLAELQFKQMSPEALLASLNSLTSLSGSGSQKIPASPDALQTVASKFDNVSMQFEPGANFERAGLASLQAPSTLVNSETTLAEIPLWKMNLEAAALRAAPQGTALEKEANFNKARLVPLEGLAMISDPLQLATSATGLRGFENAGPQSDLNSTQLRVSQSRTVFSTASGSANESGPQQLLNQSFFSSEQFLRSNLSDEGSLQNNYLGAETNSGLHDSFGTATNTKGFVLSSGAVQPDQKGSFQGDNRGQNQNQSDQGRGMPGSALLAELSKDKGGDKAIDKSDSFFALPIAGESTKLGSTGSDSGKIGSSGSASSSGISAGEARAISQAAVTRAQDLTAELQAKGGGTAKVQIRDGKLGVIDLKINMGIENKVYIEISSNNEKIKAELEKGLDELKRSLDKQNLTLADFKLVSSANSASSDFQSSQDNSNNSNRGQENNQPQQQQQQQNNFFGSSTNSGSSGNSNFGQNGWQDSGTRFENPAQYSRQKGTEASSSAASDRHKNVQRGANGSLKVFA